MNYKDKFTNISVANDSLFADALGGAVFSAKNNSLMILLDKDITDDALIKTLKDNIKFKDCYIFGKSGAISDYVENVVTDTSQTSANNGTYNRELASQLRKKIADYRTVNHQASSGWNECYDKLQLYTDNYAKDGLLRLNKEDTISINENKYCTVTMITDIRISTSSSDADNIFEQLKNSGDLISRLPGYFQYTQLNVSVYNDESNNYVAVVLSEFSETTTTIGPIEWEIYP